MKKLTYFACSMMLAHKENAVLGSGAGIATASWVVLEKSFESLNAMLPRRTDG